jgi:hypothetical protein
VTKVTMDEVNEVVNKFARRQNSMRLGQFLMNELMPGESCSEVYYEDSAIIAMDEFVKRFVEY